MREFDDDCGNRMNTWRGGKSVQATGASSLSTADDTPDTRPCGACTASCALGPFFTLHANS